MVNEINFGAIATAWRQGGKDAALAELKRQGYEIVRADSNLPKQIIEIMTEAVEDNLSMANEIVGTAEDVAVDCLKALHRQGYEIVSKQMISAEDADRRVLRTAFVAVRPDVSVQVFDGGIDTGLHLNPCASAEREAIERLTRPFQITINERLARDPEFAREVAKAMEELNEEDI